MNRFHRLVLLKWLKLIKLDEIKAAVTSYTVTPNNGVTPKTVTINAGTNIDLKTLMTRKNN